MNVLSFIQLHNVLVAADSVTVDLPANQLVKHTERDKDVINLVYKDATVMLATYGIEIDVFYRKCVPESKQKLRKL